MLLVFLACSLGTITRVKQPSWAAFAPTHELTSDPWSPVSYSSSDATGEGREGGSLTATASSIMEELGDNRTAVK